MSDAEAALAAYARWGADGVARLRGDWVLVARDEGRDRIELWRDQHGASSLFFTVDSGTVSVATSRAPMMRALPSRSVDDALIAAQIVGLQPADPTVTAVQGLRRVPRGHRAVIASSGVRVERYWEPIDVAPRGRAQGTDAELLAALEKATTRRLGRAVTGVGLSGGLDSSALASIAASQLAGNGSRGIVALSAVNAFCAEAFVTRGQLPDEFALAEAAAEYVGAEFVPVDGSAITPVEGMRRAADTLLTPIFAAANCYWMLSVAEAAASRDIDTVLMATSGDLTISWRGNEFSAGWAYARRRLGTRRWLRELQRRHFQPVEATRPWEGLAEEWTRLTAIHPRLLADKAVRERLSAQSRRRLPSNPIQARCELLRRDSSTEVGELFAAAGVTVRDPTADLQVIEAALAIPDRDHIDPTTGMHRMAIRRAMAGRLPDAVRMNRRYGVQGADVVLRLRASAAEVDAALDEIARGEGASYVDVPRMRDAWARVQSEDSPGSLRVARHLLCRGIMAGLAINNLA